MLGVREVEDIFYTLAKFTDYLYKKERKYKAEIKDRLKHC